MICYLFEVLKIEKPKLINLSKIGNGYDTSLVTIRLKEEGLISISSTYNSSYEKTLCFLFENGIIEQHNDVIKIKGPTLNLDKQGFFKPPKIKKNIKIKDKEDYSNSLVNSVKYFLDHVKNKKIFDKKTTETSLRTNSIIIN